MAHDDRRFFDELKQAVAQTAAERLGIRKPLDAWSVNDIRDFQADLEAKCRSTVSEKWFYTHFKNEHPRLPRVDVLNLLAEYVGEKNYDAFVFSRGGTEASASPDAAPVHYPASRRLGSPWRFIALAVAVLLGVAGFMYTQREEAPRVVFVDAYTRDEIALRSLMITVNRHQYSDFSSVKLRSGDSITVDAPLYKQRRFVAPEQRTDSVIIELYPDDYALMLTYFSRSKTDDIDRRRGQLLEAIHPEARIFQSHPEYEGIELLNREEFIDRLLLPIQSLQNLEVQHIEYLDKQIFRLQFTQNPSK